MNRKALSDKILILGVDGMDPSLTKKFMDMGELPNVKKYLERGVARDDLIMQGAHPTITPPMWTTMATGTCPGTHGITCFWNQDHDNLDTLVYALDSRKCHSEQLWNVFAEAGKKTLVWHWPGSSWPPTSDNPNLYVVDGTQPSWINLGNAVVDGEKIVIADKSFGEAIFKPKVQINNGAGCVLSDIDAADEEAGSATIANNVRGNGGGGMRNIELSESDGELGLDDAPVDVVNSPIREPKGWSTEVPADALEITILVENGYVRHPSLMLKNEQGVYDTIAMYASKKDEEPLVVTTLDTPIKYYVDVLTRNEKKVECLRFIKITAMNPDGSYVKLVIGNAVDSTDDKVWHPKTFLKEIVDNVSLIPVGASHGAAEPETARSLLLDGWEVMCDYQSQALRYCAEQAGFEVIFSHLHNVDGMGHKFWHHAKPKDDTPEAIARAEAYQKIILDVYRQTDRYLGSFLHLLDEGWSILIMSDHGLMTMEEEHPPLIGDAFGCNVRVLQELGFTVLKQDENGSDIKEIDWAKTRAVSSRGGHIFINLKGRQPNGCVDPADQYEVEEELIKALYHYEYKGRRAISLALRNKDAKVLGMYGPECGDVIYFLAEGFNRIHGDSLTTSKGYWETSVAPIVIFAGKGFKQGETIDRMIQQVDFAPTVAALGGVRMPKDCEGAPVYQAFAEEF